VLIAGVYAEIEHQPAARNFITGEPARIARLKGTLLQKHLGGTLLAATSARVGRQHPGSHSIDTQELDFM